MRHPLVLVILAFIVWSGIFLLVYATQAAGCSLGWHGDDVAVWQSPLRLILILLVIAGLAASIGARAWLRQRNTVTAVSETSVFLSTIKAYVAVAAIFSTAFCFAGVFWLTLCAA